MRYRYLLFLLAGPAVCQTVQPPVPTSPIKTAGRRLPATCKVGDLYFLTTATPGANLYGCTATNTWTITIGSGGGGGGGTPGGSDGQLQVNRSGAFGGISIGGDCTLAPLTGAVTCTKTAGSLFGTAATRDVGTVTGTVAAGNDTRIVGAEQAANKGALNGYASLDGAGKVPATQLPAASGMTAVIQDTTPQLGGALNMGAFSIQTVTPTEMAFLHGVTSGLQGQIDGKPALSLLTTLGDIPYRGASTWGRVAPNISSTRMFLRQSGTGSVSAAPAWDVLQVGDIFSGAQSGNTIFAGPNGSSGLPTFRSLVSGDIPPLSYIPLSTPTTGTYLRGNGSGWFGSTILAADVPTLNQSTTGNSAGLAGGVAGQFPYQTGVGATGFRTPNVANGPVVLDVSGNAAVPGTSTATGFISIDTTHSGIDYLKGMTSGGVAFAVADVAGTATALIYPTDSSTASTGNVLAIGGTITCPTLPTGSPIACRSTSWAASGAGTLSASGTPLIHQVAAWTNSATLKGLAVGTDNQVFLGSTGNDPAFGSLPVGALPGENVLTATSASGTVYTGTLPSGVTISACVAGELYILVVDVANTSTTPTVTFGSCGPKTITKVVGGVASALAVGDLCVPSGSSKMYALLRYDAVTMQMVSPGCIAPSGTGNVIGPATNTDNFIPQWNGANSKTLKDGIAVAQAATASTIAQRNSSGEVIAVNTVATGKTAMATDTAVVAAQMPALTGDATTSAGAVATTLAAKLRTVSRCEVAQGTGTAGVLVDADLADLMPVMIVPVAATVTEITIRADGGTPNVILAKTHGATVTNLVSAALATAASGGISCSKTSAVTGLDGATTCSATLVTSGSANVLAAGDWLTMLSGTAGGTAKWLSACITYTVN